MLIQRTNSANEAFKSLVQLLDKELAERDGEDHGFYAQFNGIDALKHVVLVVKNSIPVGCGAFKIIDNETVEIKRMYVQLEYRKQGIAKTVLAELEKWAKELSFKQMRLETGIKQPEAIALYTHCNYQLTSNFPPYENTPDSRCFIKIV